ncbi:RpiB/LacA/LacB family sugar-phosphate isomerase [Spiroplasma cantharicola]|uniref:Galactose-6-phosphate isomerase subunit LacA n=1 Tax=Spiroplasma cantharicola TaxID=362837 RepID=A0A0M4JKD6_9MOLU|nr:RpiB/LacA/LacB family sugar-phosphate isomerase [Spiroplasma cantharicola]ALD66811.1 galactose-6-phosphate isomerase subunit LacA [Spiroplasma cantharicola]
MENIIIYINKKIDKEYKKYLLENIKSKNFTITFQEEKDMFSDLNELANKLSLKELQRVIVIDDFGTLPFMIMAQKKGVVVAQVSDYHSGRMTIEHNNSNVLSLGFAIIAKENMMDVINVYLNATFEAGRHMVRINMLENILEGE